MNRSATSSASPLAPLLALAALVAGCGTVDEKDCSDDRCSSAETRDEVLASLAGFSDPISEFLRSAVREDGSLEGDYQTILGGVGTIRGCTPERTRSFMVLSNEDLNPKTIFNTCADDPTGASEFFLLLPTLASNHDFEPREVHMTAWDAEAGEYRRYATAPREGGGMTVNVQPKYCLSCHAGPRELGTWQPLMNEMTNPWSQWNAEPGFRSHAFDEDLPQDSAAGAVFAEVSAQGLLDSASNFEPIVRAGIDRVTGARVATRYNEANVDEALELLQPLFCDEQVNYVSEIHRSGEIRSAAIIDDAVREILIALDADDGLAFVHEDTVRLPPPTDAEDNLTLVAVRGESSLQSELALLSRLVLEPLQALQIRSIDWMRPVDSAFRCELFERGSERIREGVLDDELPSLGPSPDNAALVGLFIQELATYVANGRRIPLLAPDGQVYSIPNAAVADFDALRAVSPAELGAEMQSALDGATRSALDLVRRERACRSVARYIIAPIIPGIACF